MKDGLIRVAAVTPEIIVADVAHNIDEMNRLIHLAAQRQCGVAVFPALCVTGATCGDLLRQALLLSQAESGLADLMHRTRSLDLLCVVGLPVPVSGALYHCAAVFHQGRLLGLCAKSFIQNGSDIKESRYFAPGFSYAGIRFAGQETHIGTDLLFCCANVPHLTVGVEIGQDLCVPSPPSVLLAQNGASVLVSPACDAEIVGRAAYRRELFRIHSRRITAAYVGAGCGRGESTTDMVFAGHRLIAENGTILKESPLFSAGITLVDIDLERIFQARLGEPQRQAQVQTQIRRIPFAYDAKTLKSFTPDRRYPPYPFVPEDPAVLKERCETILTMQATGLSSRIKHIGCRDAVLGLSGGLDSALALLVTVRAFDLLGLSREGIHSVSMPGFGTTKRTRQNAGDIAKALGVQFAEIPIEQAVLQHFSDIGHDAKAHDTTYENAQARERTQLLMDLANSYGGIVVGTGDLSELALGFATYNGDHMSMYGVNADIPKTLLRHLLRYAADHGDEQLKKNLYDVLDTPVSPELLPPKDGKISQRTEDLVGPYALHDFFLYYMLRFGFAPGKIFRMALRSFDGMFEADTIKKWIGVFYRRFFAQQFKRSCLPDGVKVGSVGLSPRGDFTMPSDASASLWLKEIENL